MNNKDAFILMESVPQSWIDYSEGFDDGMTDGTVDGKSIGREQGAAGAVVVSALIYSGFKLAQAIYNKFKKTGETKAKEAPRGKKLQVYKAVKSLGAKKAIQKLNSIKVKNPKEKALVDKQIAKYQKRMK